MAQNESPRGERSETRGRSGEPESRADVGAPTEEVGAPTEEEVAEDIRRLAEQLERDGWTGSPLVVHGDQVLGGRDRYEAARFLGIENQVPRVTLEELYEEAGMDFDQIEATREGSAVTSGEEFFQDYLRDLPRHLRDKYEL